MRLTTLFWHLVQCRANDVEFVLSGDGIISARCRRYRWHGGLHDFGDYAPVPRLGDR